MSSEAHTSSPVTDLPGAQDDIQPLGGEARFVRALHRLSAGPRAILKRCAGRTIGEASGHAKIIYYGILARETPAVKGSKNEEIYFLVATLFGLNKHETTGNFWATMRTIRSKTASESTDHRMAILLDSEFGLIEGWRSGGGELAWRLRQCVRLAAGHEVGVNWTQLLQDLLWWDHHEKRARKRWARSYFGQEPIPANYALYPKGDTE